MTKVKPDILARFNGLLFPVAKSRDVPSMLELYGLNKFDETFLTKVDSLDDRREQLHNAVAILQNKNVDLNAVLEILDRAIQHKIRAYLEGYKTDEGRCFTESQRKASDALAVLSKFLKHYAHSEDPLNAIKTIAADPALELEWRGPPRRPRAGHQPEPWLGEARRELSVANVPEQLREEVLDAVGLIPHYKKPARKK